MNIFHQVFQFLLIIDYAILFLEGTLTQLTILSVNNYCLLDLKFHFDFLKL